jgi:hypothetical protein
MQCMVNVNKKNYLLFAFIFIFINYILVLIFFHYQQKQLGMTIPKNTIALIIGGSNSLQSLSAQQLSHATGMRYHNISIDAEFGNEINYNNFIINTTSEINDNIKIIIYSSILPFSFNSINKYSRYNFSKDFKIIPPISIASYLRKIIINNLNDNENLVSNKLTTNSFGDANTIEKNCLYDIEKNKFNPETLENSKNFLVERAYFLANTFNKSKIYIVLPSLYYASPVPTYSIFTDQLKESFEKYLFLKYPQISSRVTLIIQPLYSTVGHVCNDPHHATSSGRLWRTNNLLSYIINSEKNLRLRSAELAP